MKPYIFLLGLSAFFSMKAQFEVRQLHIVANDIVYDPFTNKLYVSIPSANGPNGNSLGVIGLSTYSLEQTVFIGSDPTALAISDDGEYIYSAFDGSNTVRRIKVSTLVPEQPFTLGNGSFGPYYAEDLEVKPGDHDMVVVSRQSKGVSPRHSGVAAFKNGSMLPSTTQTHTGSNRIEFSSDPNWLFGYNNESTEFGFRRLKLDSNGVTQMGVFQNLLGGFNSDFRCYGNKVYGSSGTSLDVTNAPYVDGQFFSYSNGQVTFDPALNLVAYAIFSWNNSVKFKRFNPQTFLVYDSIALPPVDGPVKSMVNCGPGCYAFVTSDNSIIIINPSPTGLSKNENIPKISFYPNPVSDVLHMSGAGVVNNVEITDMLGNVMEMRILSDYSIDVSALATGIYNVNFRDGSGRTFAKKLLKQ